MQILRKSRRFFSALLLCTGLFSLASANTPALGAAINTTAPTGAASNEMAVQYAYNIGYMIGALLNLAGYGIAGEAQVNSDSQLPAPTYQATDFSTFD